LISECGPIVTSSPAQTPPRRTAPWPTRQRADKITGPVTSADDATVAERCTATPAEIRSNSGGSDPSKSSTRSPIRPITSHGASRGSATRNAAAPPATLPVLWLAAVVAGALLTVVALTAIPTRISARRPAAEVLQAETR